WRSSRTRRTSPRSTATSTSSTTSPALPTAGRPQPTGKHLARAAAVDGTPQPARASVSLATGLADPQHLHMGTGVDSLAAVRLLEVEAELPVLSEALAEARLGHGRVVFVAGEAGAGKTSLVRAFAAFIAGRARVLFGACDALSTPRPLGPFLDAGRDGMLP